MTLITKIIPSCIIIMICLSALNPAFSEPQKGETGISYRYNLSGSGDVEVSSRSRSQRLFKNQTLSSGLASGTKAINREIESLMEAFFYSVLDRELIFDINDVTNIGVVLARDVVPNDLGGYVVIDRFSMGPRYNKVLAEMGKIPLSLNANISNNVFDIYLRTDAIRLGHHVDQPFWRRILNNWFGVLPLLSAVLPPAFNSNELYDPANLIVNPFTFPTTKDGFYQMTPGGIRSYSVTSGVKFPFEFSKLIDDDTRESLGDEDVLGFEIPYTIFVEGEHRINVLRKSDHIAWIGLSRDRKIGHALSAKLGQTLKVFQKLSPLFSGIPVPIFPTDLGTSQALSSKLDQLYEFDMRNTFAQEAYAKAANGDFTLAHKRHLDRVEKNLDTGVTYHFTRDEDAIEYEGRNSFNVFVGRNSRSTFQNSSEIEIRDKNGISHVLESSRETEDELWDMFVGPQRKSVQDKAELRVKKVTVEREGEGKTTKYIFSPTDKDPLSVYLHMQIYDRYADSSDYRGYIEKIKKFTRLSLSKAPHFPLREQSKLKFRRKRYSLSDPSRDEFDTHVSYTALGRFNAVASIRLDTEMIRKIINQPESSMWAAFATAFGQDPKYWKEIENRRGFSSIINWTKAISTYPLKLINIRSASSDFIWEASRSISALRNLRDKKEPMEKLAGFDDLFSTDHPDELAEALLLIAPTKEVPRSVTIYTSPKGSASDRIKERYRKLNGRVFKSAAPYGSPNNIQITQDKLDAFNPLALKDHRVPPVIQNIEVQTRKLPEDALQEITGNVIASAGSVVRLDSRHIFVEVDLEEAKLNNGKAKFFVRVEQGAEVQFGRFLIGEKVFTRRSLITSSKTRKKFGFWLTGPRSPLSGLFYDQAVNIGGKFTVNLQASTDGKVWSNVRVLRFYFDDGRITPP